MQLEHATLIPRSCQPLPGTGPSLDEMAAPARFPAAGTAATPGLGLAQPRRRGEPFRDAEACLVWTIRQLAAEAEAEKKPARAAICSPHEVVKCLDKLYRQRRIDLHHVRILRLWAHRGRAPDPRNPIERADARIWREALDRLEWPLRTLGIVS